MSTQPEERADGEPVRRELPLEAFRSIVESISVPVFVTDAEGNQVYANSCLAEVMGFSRDELQGRNVVEFVPPDEVDRALAAMGDLLRHEEIGIGVPVVFPITRADGSLTWNEVGAVPLYDDPHVAGILMYFLGWDAELQFDEFVASLLAGEPLEDVLGRLCRSIATSLEAEGAVVHHGYDGHAFLAESGHGSPTDCLDTAGLPGPWHEAAASGRPVYGATTELPEPARSTAADRGLGACWAIPVPTRRDLPPAVLTVWRRAPTAPVTAHQFVLHRSLRYVELALVHWSEHQRLAHLAGHDALTGVANRTLFRDRLAEALAIGEREVAVAFCDIDDFKVVNDGLGHLVGDTVLVEVARRLSSALRTGDELARVGGDEFIVLLRNIGDADDAAHVAERLLATMKEPVEVPGATLQVGLSIGLALARPGMTSDDTVAEADAALYLVKHSGKGAAQVAVPRSD